MGRCSLSGSGLLCTIAAIGVACGLTMPPAAASSVATSGASTASVSPEKYIHSICLGFRDFKHDLKATLRDLKHAGQDLPAKRDALVTYFGDDAQAASRFVDRLGHAGSPSVKNGRKIADLITAVFAGIRDALVRAQDGAKVLPVDDPVAFGKAGDKLLSAFRRASDRSVKAFKAVKGKYDTADLDDAEANDPSCSALEAGF